MRFIWISKFLVLPLVDIKAFQQYRCENAVGYRNTCAHSNIILHNLVNKETQSWPLMYTVSDLPAALVIKRVAQKSPDEGRVRDTHRSPDGRHATIKDSGHVGSEKPLRPSRSPHRRPRVWRLLFLDKSVTELESMLFWHSHPETYHNTRKLII